jgi:hypothetical protein
MMSLSTWSNDQTSHVKVRFRCLYHNESLASDRITRSLQTRGHHVGKSLTLPTTEWLASFQQAPELAQHKNQMQAHLNLDFEQTVVGARCRIDTPTRHRQFQSWHPTRIGGNGATILGDKHAFWKTALME